MEEGNNMRVCVTGGSGYLGSWLIKKLLEKGYTVHATLRNLDEERKTSHLKSLPNAESRLELFQADIYNPEDFEAAIQGCLFVFHVATPVLHTENSKYKDTSEAAIAGVRAIADSCLRSQTVKRLIYTASVTSVSALKEDGTGFRTSMDESCWTSLNLSYTYSNQFTLDYIKSKTLSEKEILRYNEIETGNKLEVVSLACGLVGGETILSYLPSSLPCVLSLLTGDRLNFDMLRFLQELLGSIPLVHIDDVCEAHIFCMEKPVLRGRFLCAAEAPTIEEMAICYQQNHPEFTISQEFMSGPDGRSKCDVSKLRKEGFVYKYGMKETLDHSVKCARRLGSL
ncbi:NAD(P)-binding Rossmann-fold superfamily protein [Abeliophyllum distichum]|uniref:NAD(P)-binding Rossmann-fold superfamily protein n=1 Tax=Abeliophyllum distichum TaxID=126358 RepID=A0ABD1URU4_9LAMI